MNNPGTSDAPHLKLPATASEWVALWRLCELASQSRSQQIRKRALRAIGKSEYASVPAIRGCVIPIAKGA